MRTRSLILTLAVLCCVPIFPLAGQPPLTPDDYARAERFLPWNFNQLVFNAKVDPHFIGKTDRFWYKSETPGGKEFVFVDPALGLRRPAFDQSRLAASLSAAAGAAYEALKLPFDSFEYSSDGASIRFEAGKALWTCDLKSYALQKGDAPKARNEGESLSPDGRWAAFIKDHDLYVRPTAGGDEIRLTADGEPNYGYGTDTEQTTSAVTTRLSGRKQPPLLLWSPDSKKILTHKLDQRNVEPLYLLQSAPPSGPGRPILHAYRYAMPGDENLPLAEMVILDVEQTRRIPLDSRPLPLSFLSPFTLQHAWWSEDGRKAYVIEEGRGNKSVRLMSADADTGETRLLVEESGVSYVELNLTVATRPNVRTLNRGAELIWFSERDGWGHLYLYDALTGALKNRITRGPWVVRDIVSVDEAGRWVYFMGCGREEGRDPYLQHLYRSKLDGSQTQLLTPEDAEHAVVFSPSGRFFVDTFSRVDLAPVSLLRNSEGRLVRNLERADVDRLLATGWKWPERFAVKASDGITDIFGVITKPSNFDPAQAYPVIDGVYPGPQAIRSPKSFGTILTSMDSALSELGFVVVNIDGLGTPYRSKALHDRSYGRLEEAGGLQDHVAGLRQAAATRPYLDLNRVGVWGHSGGGFASARAILAYPEFYRVAVSSAGNHDVRGYIAGWGEKYQGLPAGRNYDSQSNASLAGNLRGRLLLACGDMDDNVHPAMTLQLADALIKANKDFDFLLLPNRNHGYYLDPYFIRRLWDYFVRHLLGAEPPQGYEIKK